MLTTKELVPILANELRNLGFRLAYKSPTGSHYLAWPKTPFQLRVSDHKYSRRSAKAQAQVVKNFVPPPTAAADVPGLALDVGIGFIIRAKLRTGIIGGDR
jgi:hypothetical protein